MKLRWVERKELVQADVGMGAATIKTVKVLQYWDKDTIYVTEGRHITRGKWVDVPTVVDPVP